MKTRKNILKLLRRLHAPLRNYVRKLAGESNVDDILLVVVTSKIVVLINKNTTAILRAIAAIEEQVRIQSKRQPMS